MSHVSRRCRARCQQVLEELAAQSSVQVYPTAALASAVAPGIAGQQLGARDPRAPSVPPASLPVSGTQAAQAQAQLSIAPSSSNPVLASAPSAATAVSTSANGAASLGANAASRMVSALSTLVMPEATLDSAFMFRM